MSTTALRKYSQLKLELLETERAMELKSAIMHDEVCGIARTQQDDDLPFRHHEGVCDGQLTDLWWAMLAGKNRLESHRAGIIWELNQLQPKVMQDRVFLIILAVANGYGIPFGDLIGKTRKTPIAEARAICWALLLNHSTATQQDIGDVFDRLASSVSNQYRTAIEWLFVARDNRVLANYGNVQLHLSELVPDIDVEAPLEMRSDSRNEMKQAS